MREQQIQQQIRAVLNTQGASTRVWRNNVGKYQDSRGVWVSYGLAVGSSDLVGIRKVVITPDMVGSVIGQFFCVEVKTPTGKTSKEQEIWAETIQRFGGEAFLWRSGENAVEYLRRTAGGAN